MKAPPTYPIYPLRNLQELVLETGRRYAERTAMKSKKGGEYRSITYGEFRDRTLQLSAAFSEWGLKKGDRVAILSENRTEWAVTYLALAASGRIAVPVDRDFTPSEIRRIFSLSRPKAVVCSSDYLERVLECRREVPDLELVVSMEEERGGAELCLAEAFEAAGRRNSEGGAALDLCPIDEDDVAAIIFTSGTTGDPKGVMLTHGNLASNIVSTAQYVSIRDGVLLSVLPLHHTYECMGGFLLALYQGCTICHAESLRRIPENLAECQATVILGVPLLFEALYRRIEEGVRAEGEGLFRMAKRLADLSERVLGKNIRRTLFRRIHEKLGGRVELLISGGAAIRPEVARGFRELGIHFIQGYGMTEASPIIAVNRVGYFKDEAVGRPLPGLEVEIRDGEIVVRGPSVMKGYYENPSATQKALRDGWLHTGDLGRFDEDGFLHINGRSKSVIVTPNGKNIYPEEVEGVLNASPYILESLVWGGPGEDPSQVEVQAIVVPQRESFEQGPGRDGCDEERIREILALEIRERCRDLAPYKRVKNFTVRATEFEKTTTKKIKRHLYT